MREYRGRSDSVRGFFRNFEQTTDEEVRTLLSETRNDQEALWAA